MNTALLWLAQGFGIGRVPFAPGTCGSILGVVWFAALLGTGNIWIYLIGTVAGLGISVWTCEVAEKALGQKDPGSVVMDEITAIPICFLPFVVEALNRTSALPSLQSLWSKNGWLIVLTTFALFRFFDIAKPWPVKQSQVIPGGWGITVDDVLAAVYTAAAAFGILYMLGRHKL